MSVIVRVSEDVVDVEVGGLDVLWGFRKRVELPLSRIEVVGVSPVDEAKSDLRLRLGGLGFPGLAAVGHFRGRERRRQWWRVYRADQVLVLDLAADGAFDRVVLEVDDPAAVAAQINAARESSAPASG